jgi:hypothetical protein
MKQVTDERAIQYASDPILFEEEQFVLPETRKPIKLEPWQRDWILKPLFYDLTAEGGRKYNIALIGLPKKNGKSTLGAGIGVWFMYAGERYGEIIIAANAKDQASMIIYTKMRRSITLNPNLKQGTTLLKDALEVKSTGTTARCVAHQYETAAGLNPNLTIFDELWAFSDRRFYDELTVVPTRRDPLIVIVTYAGYEQKGLLWELYCDGLAGTPILDTGSPDIIVRRGEKDPRMFMLWSHKNLASWVTPEYLKSQRGRLPPEVYARLHENRWVSLASQFITPEDIAAMHLQPWIMQTRASPDRLLQYIVATDLGLSHDRTARVVGHYDPLDGQIYVDNIRVWQGTTDQHVDIREVEEDLVQCAHDFRAHKLVIDPWQMEYVIQRLKSTYSVVPFNPNTEMPHLSQIFVNMLRSHRIVCYQESALEEELRNTIIKQTMAGWRIDHVGKKHNDIVIALGMMMREAVKGQYAALDIPGEEEFVSTPVGFRGIRTQEF